jgi:hypothetical protein
METNQLISNFIVNIFEKNYSDANLTLKKIISEKTKQKIKKLVNGKKDNKKKVKKDHKCSCEDEKNHKNVNNKG